MKNNLYVLSVCLMSFFAFDYAMENNDDEVIDVEQLSMEQRLGKSTGKENFGDAENTLPNKPGSLQSVERNIENRKQKKKKKKDKKEIKDDVSDQLEQLQQGIAPEDIDKQIIAKLKIYKNDLTPDEETVIKNYLDITRESSPDNYNQFKQRILAEKTTVKRGLFTKQEVSPEIKELQKAVVKLTIVTESQNACNQLLADAFRKNIEIQQQQLILAKQSGETQNKQLKAVEEGNANMVASYLLNDKWYKFMKKATIVNSAVSLSALILSIIALATE